MGDHLQRETTSQNNVLTTEANGVHKDPVHSYELATRSDVSSHSHELTDGGRCEKDPPEKKSLLGDAGDSRGVDKGVDSQVGDGKTREERETPESPFPGLPVDRGWAWVIMIAQFVIVLLMVGYGRALSIFFLEFIEMFQVPVTMGTTNFGTMTVCFGFANVVVSQALLPRLSARTIVLAGAVINAVSIGLSALAPSMIFIIVTHCFIGMSHAMMYVPSVTLLGNYFNARRSFAMAVANSGISVSALIFPPLTQHLITSYGARGALLLISGLAMQTVVAASLLRPESFYTRGAARKTDTGGEVKNGQIKDDGDRGEKVPLAEKSPLRSDGKKIVLDQGDAPTAATRLLAESEERDSGVNYPGWKPTPRDTIPPPVSTSLPEKSFLSTDCAVNQYASSDVLHTYNHQANGVRARTYSRQYSCPSDPQQHGITAAHSLRAVSVHSSSVVDVCGSAVSLAPVVVRASSENPKGQDPGVAAEDNASDRRRGWCGRCLSVVGNVVDLSLFKNWLFLLILAYAPLGLSSNFISFYIPSLGVMNGLSRPEAALLLTVVGGVDLVSRLAVGYFADLNLVKRTHIVAICMAVLGIAAQFSRFYTNMGLLAMFAVIFGLFGGACQNLLVVVIIDLVGLANMGKVMGLVLVLNAAFAAFNHVLIGALVDITGSFVTPFHYVGASLLVSAVILLMEPLAQRLEAKRLKKVDSDSASKQRPEKV